MAEVTKRETRNRGERRPTRTTPPAARLTSSAVPKSLKRKSLADPPPPPPAREREPLQSRDAPNLPTTTTGPGPDPQNGPYKSISESGVLGASLKQSMERWKDGGCFERFWVKNPAKKANQGFVNPPNQSMTKLGAAVLVIEPHSFEVILYAVKAGISHSAGASAKASPAQTVAPSSSASKPLQSATTPLAKNSSTASSMKTIGDVSEEQGQSDLVSSSQKPSSQASSSATNTPAQLQRTSSDPSSDNPVILELAHRASKDPQLKELMKTVASGGASEQQVKKFQEHIDDINKMLRKKSTQKTPQSATQLGSAQKHTISGSQLNQHTWTKPITPNVKQEPGTQFRQTPILMPKSKVPSASNFEISHVVFEFAIGSGDRYLIPRRSLLEFGDGNRVAVLSFLIHLKGINANGGFYQSDKEYCELITVKLLADRPAVLEPLKRVVDPADAVQRHMEDWADKMTVAEKAWLVLRVASSLESEESRIESTIPMATNETGLSEYEAPNSLFPLRKGPNTPQV